ncbi:hypothetical protein PYW08_012344 [Mythimna loreyi]|uniref:Uncharacterized protein n=1 Tax=Mythimna loreyi TaxID=667449 RepID=A0ACC2Q0E8_9NEOP|nr:hypothetical protein PYW08_012344 [Mythimna loreyi]
MRDDSVNEHVQRYSWCGFLYQSTYRTRARREQDTRPMTISRFRRASLLYKSVMVFGLYYTLYARSVHLLEKRHVLALHVNDPSAGSPTETLLRLLLPLNDQVWSTSQQRRRP